ncbi:MAG: electron transfer flavoprotein subunit alpha/FixB family protein [Planctomycetota bacterium]|nr:MAG: electron transfer flavoprotein subunit alpha/FixB family protein [Planctomycetota bacterium]
MKKVLIVAQPEDSCSMELLGVAEVFQPCLIQVAIFGDDLKLSKEKWTPWADRILGFEHPQLQWFDTDFAARVLAPVLLEEMPDLILTSRTNPGLELLPVLSGITGFPAFSDCLRVRFEDGDWIADKAEFEGKVIHSFRLPVGEVPICMSVRPGSFQTPAAIQKKAADYQLMSVPDHCPPRREFLELLDSSAEGVDIRKSKRLVAVGRGIEDQEQLEVAESLAKALNAELASTRPLVDQGWLEKSRQVGTSGVTVNPDLYLTVGVSGSFQHMGGIQGKPFIVAINRDPKAPVFNYANVGMVGDLFELVPLLEQEILKLGE